MQELTQFMLSKNRLLSSIIFARDPLQNNAQDR